MKVKQTIYRSRRFRSRTEARYAVFFDALAEEWEYELEGFSLEDESYLPDFYLPRLKTFIEIKGPRPTAKEIRTARKFQYYHEADIAIFHGMPTEHEGLLFSWSADRGGMFTEEKTQWTINDGFLALTDYPAAHNRLLKAAAARAIGARFEWGEVAELEASRPLVSIVDYEQIAF